MSNRKRNNLQILPPNKTVAFCSPFDGRDVLVRTGTIDDNSFFHALLHSYSNEYVRLNDRGRKKMVVKLCSDISKKENRKRWENDLSSTELFQDQLVHILRDVYAYVVDNRSIKNRENKKLVKSIMERRKDIETYEILCELIPLSDYERKILPSCRNSSVNKSKEMIVARSIKQFEEITGKSLDNQKKDFCISKLKTLLQKVMDHADREAYDLYVSDSKKKMEVNDDTITLVSEHLRRDLYFIDSRSRIPYQAGDKNSVKGRKSIILMCIQGDHYEVVGRTLEGNRIEREFYKNDPLIRRINTFLYKPDHVPEEYPHLTPYLPKEYREPVGFEDSSNASYTEGEDSEDLTSDESDW